MHPRPLGMRGVDGGEGALVVVPALDGPHGPVEHVGPDVEGKAGGPVVSDDPVAARCGQGGEVADPNRVDRAEDVGAHLPHRGSAHQGDRAISIVHDAEASELPRRAELL